MALVTVQRSPSVTGSPQCSNSDSEADEEEGSKNEKSAFAGKGTAFISEHKDIMPQYPERRLSTDSIRSTNSTQSNNSDIHQHLQSMFYLLRHEETLKMAVKLESQRANRTRYLVIASRCCYRPTTTERRSKITRHNSARVSSSSSSSGATMGQMGQPMGAMNTARQLSMDGSSSCRTSSQHQQQLQQIDDALVEMREKRMSTNSAVLRQSLKCDGSEKACASGDNKSNSAASQPLTATTAITTMATSSAMTAASSAISSCALSSMNASAAECGGALGMGVEESCLLGIDCNERTTIGLVVPILAETTIHLDGDGGFSVSVYNKTHIFKPVSVQAMWSALQTIHKVSQKARENNFYHGGPSHDWLSYYESRIESEQSCLNEWNDMDSLESRRPPPPDAIRNKPTAKEATEGIIKMKLKEIMMSVDLDEVTSKYIRSRLEEHLDVDLGEYKSFIDTEMLMILGQMDSPTEIFDHVYLGSEWNASNLEELQKNGVRHILNVTREIDNFFPGMFDYLNVRVYDDEKTNLLKYWDNTYRYINQAKCEGSKVLVHCKMGVSRSASVVIAYAMKAYNWEFQKALQHVKQRRSCIKPNKNFLNQLETYRGMLDAMKNKEKLQRSKSETNLKSTKDARLLPGSEPTPLIQALNHSKTKSGGDSSDNDAVVNSASIGVPHMVGPTLTRPTTRSISSASDLKHRRLMRRSSSTSPRTVQAPMAATIVVKQQSQSLENLTPDRSVADEPKNMRFPGSNGENYSVTQNQVLHIQKHTPPSNSSAKRSDLTLVGDVRKRESTPVVVTSVRTFVNDLENHQVHDGPRKATEDKKSFNLPFGKTSEDDVGATSTDTQSVDSSTKVGSPVWTSSARLVTQTSNINAAHQREDAIQKRHHNRKTQSWAATSGGIVMDASCQGSNSSIDSISTQSSAPAAATSTTTTYEGIVRTRSRQRELPSRHSSWGSGDNRCGMPIRNSSWGAFDTNRNSCQYSYNQHSNANAIFEGQIHDLHASYKTASAESRSTHCKLPHHHHFGTVKRTKQKLEESTTLKKLCQENGSEAESLDKAHALTEEQNPKRSSNLFRSASAASSTRTRFAQRCNSEELVPTGGCNEMTQSDHSSGRRSDGNRAAITTDLFSASAPETYTMSDIENKNTLTGSGSDEENVILRSDSQLSCAGSQRISGNVQILKKSFEAKAGAGVGSIAHSNVTVGTNSPGTTNAVVGSTPANKGSKGHQSLPSSPVAQHSDAHNQGLHQTKPFLEQSVPANQSNAHMAVSSTSDQGDRNVKGLVNKYQTSTNPGATRPSAQAASAIASATSAVIKPRPRSCYEPQKSLTGKAHEFSESRPPPAPQKTAATTNVPSHINLGEGIAVQHPPPQQRRQHGKTHPLARLSLPKQSFNTAAYNTM